ncbi:MAG: hypothetical protein JW955_07450 [Sedimentisphaerales bacterium]|nr:hypothetical protein [Sedimentisphaerales bacterium]
MRTVESRTRWTVLWFALLLPISSTARVETRGPSIVSRITTRDFPSVFQAWGQAENVADVNQIEAVAKHDLMWSCIGLGGGLQWDTTPRGLAEQFTASSIERGRAVRKQLLKLNPHIILIAEIRYRDAPPSWLPEGHEWWMHAENGQIARGWDEGGYLRLDYRNAQFRKHVAKRAKAAIESGVADGIMLDWWNDDDYRLALVKEVRAAIGEVALIIVNTNHRKAPRSASYVNGLFMECLASSTPRDWETIPETLTWAESSLRPPHVNCVEVWCQNSRRDLHLMRAVTTLVLTHSNGYCLFSDPNPLPTPDHLHDWYPFWSKGLGKPLANAAPRDDNAVMREFEKGIAVYNPMGNRAVEVVLDEAHTSRATARSSRIHTLAPCDGDIYLRSR